MITPLLQSAIDRLSTMSVSQQNCVAALIFDELASEKLWQELFEKSPGQLEQMAIAAMREYNEKSRK